MELCSASHLQKVQIGQPANRAGNPQSHCNALLSIGKQPWNRQFRMRKGGQPERVQGRKGVIGKCNFAVEGPKTKHALHQMPVCVLLLFACSLCWLYWCFWRCAPHCQSWCFPSWNNSLPAAGHGSQTAVHFKQNFQEEVSSSKCCSPSDNQPRAERLLQTTMLTQPDL